MRSPRRTPSQPDVPTNLTSRAIVFGRRRPEHTDRNVEPTRLHEDGLQSVNWSSKQRGHTHLKDAESCRCLSSLGDTLLHLMWHYLQHMSQSKARWLCATDLSQTVHGFCIGPELGWISPAIKMPKFTAAPARPTVGHYGIGVSPRSKFLENYMQMQS